jgi:hypothetical protein
MIASQLQYCILSYLWINEQSKNEVCHLHHEVDSENLVMLVDLCNLPDRAQGVPWWLRSFEFICFDCSSSLPPIEHPSPHHFHRCLPILQEILSRLLVSPTSRLTSSIIRGSVNVLSPEQILLLHLHTTWADGKTGKVCQVTDKDRIAIVFSNSEGTREEPGHCITERATQTSNASSSFPEVMRHSRNQLIGYCCWYQALCH